MSTTPTSPDYFITGTDTEIGKTLAACAVMHALQQRGKIVVGMKPVAAGRSANGSNDDVRQLLAASNRVQKLKEHDICPYVFDDPIAPHLAAHAQGMTIEPSQILASYQALKNTADNVVVEGAGGLRVPLGTVENPWDTVDLIEMLGCHVILVVGMKLGCINHALLTMEAMAVRKIPVTGWIANQIDPKMALIAENLATLTQLLGRQYKIPLLGHIPFLHDGEDAISASRYLNL